ncbi:MAG: hypothetical protein L0287_15245 [Anaerolineae bacterium]|nr:hypothetical protein [Anaerolineae bacterium]
MKPRIRFITLVIIVILIASACNSPAPTATATATPAVSPTETTAPTATATLEPSLTPTPTVLDLEILEWSEWPYTNLSDPSNTDTHVEVLIRNPNDVPVRVNRDERELRFINAAGEVVYANDAGFWYIWQGEWILPNETAALSACVCFDTQGLEKQDWESLELFAPLEIATDIAYTLDVEVKLGEIVDIAAAHLGGSGFALETNFANTGDQELESVPHRVLARDASGRYIGVAFAGNAVVSFTKNLAIQPGDTATGLNVIEIDYIDESSLPTLTYEVAAIGIPYQPAEATAEAALPAGTPQAEWNGIPIMPGALAGETVEGTYQFTIAADFDAIKSFYETELSKLGYELTLDVNEIGGSAILNFQKEGMTGMVVIIPIGGGIHGVAITMNT